VNAFDPSHHGGSVLQAEGKCAVESQRDGSLTVHFRVDKDTADRLKRRAGVQDLAEHLWLNVIRAAVEGYCW